jgi:curved DNA-binding protein CbpA
MGNTTNRQYTYQQYYNAIKYDKNFNFNKIDFSLLNPYEVLEVKKNFTWNELKESYKQTALLTHPDKEGGNRIVFNFVTECFKILAEEYKSRNANKSFVDLKNEAKVAFQSYNRDENIPAPITGDNFNEKFNKTFDMCKIEDEEQDFGYGDTMVESTKVREDFTQTNFFENKKFDNSSFNSLFNKNTPAPPKQLTKYKEPEPMILSKTISFTEIGGKKPDDYSSGVEKSCKNNLIYADYKIAYKNVRLVDEESLVKSMKDFKNVEDYEMYRESRLKKGLTSKEKQYFEQKKLREEQEEYERLERIKQNDLKIKLNNDRASRLFIR